MSLPLPVWGKILLHLHHRGAHRWSPLVRNHRRLRQGQEIWLLSQWAWVFQSWFYEALIPIKLTPLALICGTNVTIFQQPQLFIIMSMANILFSVFSQFSSRLTGTATKHHVFSPSCFWGKNMTRAPQMDEMMGIAGVPLQLTLTLIRSMDSVLTEVSSTFVPSNWTLKL